MAQLEPTVLITETINVTVDGHPMEFLAWDTAGQEEYDRLRPLAYNGTDVVLMLCSKSAYTTLSNLKHKWLPEVRHHMRRVPKLLVVNKCDLDTAEPHEELITDEIINKAFREFRMGDYIKISALT